MAGILDEFDEATPLKRSYCSILTQEEYEEQGSSFTEQALSELVDHLDTNSRSYKKILKKRKLQEAEERGVLSFIKVGWCSIPICNHRFKGRILFQIEHIESKFSCGYSAYGNDTPVQDTYDKLRAYVSVVICLV